MSDFEFKTGDYSFHPNPLFNYQLNRLVMWNDGDEQEIKAAAPSIQGFDSWASTLKQLSERSLQDGHTNRAIGYLRMAEFFMPLGSPEANATYDSARKLFYQYYGELFDARRGKIQIDRVPYEDSYLPCWHLRGTRASKGVILFHGGNDSLIEEFTGSLLYLASHGYEVIAFEGPGQGEVLRKYGMKFTYQWEKPVQAVLDFYQSQQVTIVGVSLGGELALRAAAFDTRIKKAVSWCVLPSLLDVVMVNKPAEIRDKLALLMSHNEKEKINAVYEENAKKMPLFRWALDHAKSAYGADSIFDYLKQADNYSIKPIASQITQDVLLIGARQDVLVDFDLYKKEIDLLDKTHSLTFLAMSNAQYAGAHCNVGNSKLVLNSILHWLENE